MEDTDPEAERVLIELTRATPVWKKCEQIASMTEACRQLALAGLRSRYPEAGKEGLKRRLAAVILPRELVIEVFGWDPEIEGY